MGKRKQIDYWEAEDPLKIVEYLIPKYHQHLAGDTVRCIFRAPGPIPTSGKGAMATIQMYGKRMQLLTGASIIIDVSADCWESLSDIQRVALMDHELMHIVEDEETGYLTTVGHDIEEFNLIAERYGAIFSDIQAFMEAATVGVSVNG
jgi:hypothetical protein